MFPYKKSQDQHLNTTLDYRAIVEHLTTAILLLRADLSIYYLNPSCENLLELSWLRIREQPIVQHLDLAETTLDFKEILHRVLRTAQPYTHREATLKIGIKERFVDYTVSLIDDYHSGQQLIFIELQSIDRLLRISKKELQEQQHHATRHMIRSVAHEIKNPLGGIRGAAQLLARQHAVPQPFNQQMCIQEYTQVIINEADRLRVLADNLLGSPQLPHYQTLNVHEPLEHVLQLILSQHALESELSVVRDYDLSLPDIWADRGQLIQVFLNICANAVQAMNENKAFFGDHAPRLTLRTLIKRAETLHGVHHRSVVCIEIEDNGPGISHDLIESIFFPLVTGRAQGTGLGLSIVQTIVHQHQAIIDCESMPGRTVFSIKFPWQNQPQSDAD